jgi:hypothetical protein
MAWLAKAMIADLPFEDCKRSYEWRWKRQFKLYGHPEYVARVLDHRTKLLHNAVYGDGGGKQGSGAA